MVSSLERGSTRPEEYLGWVEHTIGSKIQLLQ